jgi:hypothetical protein
MNRVTPLAAGAGNFVETLTILVTPHTSSVTSVKTVNVRLVTKTETVLPTDVARMLKQMVISAAVSSATIARPSTMSVQSAMFTVKTETLRVTSVDACSVTTA